jgi:hypothetical protein
LLLATGFARAAMSLLLPSILRADIHLKGEPDP